MRRETPSPFYCFRALPVPPVSAPMVLGVIALWLLAGAAAARSKIDVILMRNGDRITCEIKKLERGQLTIRPSYSIGDIIVDWEQVERIESPQYFQVENLEGDRSSGSLAMSAPAEGAERTLEVIETGRTVTVPAEETAAIRPLNESFLKQFKGSLSFGLGSTSANSLRQLTFNGELRRQAEKNYVRFYETSSLSRQEDAADTDRHEGGAEYRRFLSRSWFLFGNTTLLQSDQAQLDLRTTITAGAGRTLLRMPRTVWNAYGGATYNREKYFAEPGVETLRKEAEGALATEFRLFRFDATEVVTYLSYFPGITDTTRYRLVFDTSLYFKWGDFYLRFGFTDNFDSRPPEGLPGNDTQTSTSIGWSF